jgi:isopenicillin N synthase-like dioxygenase
MHDVPTIDVAGLRSGRRSDLESVGRSIGEAARTIGFFWIVNYGLEREVENVIAEAQRFFALPIERKEAVALQSYFNGYAAGRRSRASAGISAPTTIAGASSSSTSIARSR